MSSRPFFFLVSFIILSVPFAPVYAIDPGLSKGSKGSDVSSLQQALSTLGFYSGEITGFFGNVTKQAVTAFQNDYADFVLAPLNLSQGTGYVGGLTAAAINGLTGTATGTPVISLRLTHPTIVAGQGTSLEWHTTNATACIASGGWEGNKNLASGLAVHPTTSTWYVLTCTNGAASATEMVLATVVGTPTPKAPEVKPIPPVIPTPPQNPGTSTTTQATSTPQQPTTTGTYYVDFSSGSDNNAGSMNAPWKHAPGDPNATGNPANTTPKAGNIIYFKGGVHYYGSIKLNANGAAGSPITLKGTGWGSGSAIIDGSDPITNWVRCSSAADCGGNPNWSNIYKTTITVPTFFQREPEIRLNLTQGDQVIIPAQTPQSTTRYYQNNENYFSVPHTSVTATSIQDTRLAVLGGQALVNAFAYIWSKPNDIAFRKITGYNAATHTIIFGGISPYTSFDTKYAIANANTAEVFNQPGEYYFNANTNTLYVWPFNNINPNGQVSMATRSVGIDINGKSHIVIDGFLIEKQSGDFTGLGAAIRKVVSGDSQDITIQNNEVTLTQTNGYGAIALSHITGVTVQNNYIHDILGNMRGIQIGTASNVLVKNNRLRNIARTGIYFGAVTNSRITGNTMTDSNSTHGNGITVYQQSDNITVDGNTVIDANIAYTEEASSNVTLYNNLFDGSDHIDKTFADWGGMSGTNRIFNNTIIGSTANSALSITIKPTDSVHYIVENNIIDGGNVHKAGMIWHNNLYTSLEWDQNAGHGWTLGSDEIVTSGTGSVMDSNYHLKAGSAAIGKGATLSNIFTTDITGRNRAHWDIGAYAF